MFRSYRASCSLPPCCCCCDFKDCVLWGDIGLRNTLRLTAADGLDAPWQSQSSSPGLLLCRCVAALLVKAFPRKCTSHPIKVEVRRAIVCARGLSGAGLGNGERGR